jgi:hypothetical protein
LYYYRREIRKGDKQNGRYTFTNATRRDLEQKDGQKRFVLSFVCVYTHTVIINKNEERKKDRAPNNTQQQQQQQVKRDFSLCCAFER